MESNRRNRRDIRGLIMSKCGIAKQIADEAAIPEGKECPECFCIMTEYEGKGFLCDNYCEKGEGDGRL